MEAPTQRIRGELVLRTACLVAALLLLVPPVRDVFYAREGGRWIRVFALAVSTAGFLTPLVRELARRRGHVDRPDPRKIHAQPTPLFGGAAVWAGVLVSLVANGIFERGFEWILVGGTLLLCVGVSDEARGIPAGAKLLLQAAAAATVMAGGGMLTLFPPGPLGTPANAALTLVWILGITNAMNFLDGLDGLAAGLSGVIAFFLGMIAAETTQPELAWFAAAVLGACLGFLPYNFRPAGGPATIFLGDGGSTFLGFTLASLAVLGDWADRNPIVSFSNPILIFGVLIYDMTHTTVARVATGRVRCFREWIEYTGRDHVHHRLAALLGGRRIAVLAILLLSVAFGLSAMALRPARTGEAILLVLQGLLIALLVTLLEQGGKRILDRAPGTGEGDPAGRPPPGKGG